MDRGNAEEVLLCFIELNILRNILFTITFPKIITVAKMCAFRGGFNDFSHNQLERQGPIHVVWNTGTICDVYFVIPTRNAFR